MEGFAYFTKPAAWQPRHQSYSRQERGQEDQLDSTLVPPIQDLSEDALAVAGIIWKEQIGTTEIVAIFTVLSP